MASLPGMGMFFLMGIFGDCVPLYFVVPEKKVVALAHGGWRGTLLNIGGEILKEMKSAFNIKPADVHVGLGPSIGFCCYEVGKDVARAFLKGFSPDDNILIPRGGGKYYLNLAKTHRKMLLQGGVKAENIKISDYCTSCRDDLFFFPQKGMGV